MFLLKGVNEISSSSAVGVTHLGKGVDNFSSLLLFCSLDVSDESLSEEFSRVLREPFRLVDLLLYDLIPEDMSDSKEFFRRPLLPALLLLTDERLLFGGRGASEGF